MHWTEPTTVIAVVAVLASAAQAVYTRQQARVAKAQAAAAKASKDDAERLRAATETHARFAELQWRNTERLAETAERQVQVALEQLALAKEERKQEKRMAFGHLKAVTLATLSIYVGQAKNYQQERSRLGRRRGAEAPGKERYFDSFNAITSSVLNLAAVMDESHAEVVQSIADRVAKVHENLMMANKFDASLSDEILRYSKELGDLQPFTPG